MTGRCGLTLCHIVTMIARCGWWLVKKKIGICTLPDFQGWSVSGVVTGDVVVG